MVKVTADHATHAPSALTVSSRAVVTAWLRSGMYSKSRSLRHASGVQSVEASPPLQLEGAPSVPVQRIGGLEAQDEPFRGSLQSWTALNTSWQYEGLATLERDGVRLLRCPLHREREQIEPRAA